MFGLFKKKSEKEKLQSQYEKLMSEAHKLASTNRKLSDEKTFQANEVMKKLEQLEQ
ncbi:Lacal_2735 family protein [uncultured Mesonia sp.]|uniref:Lacal_2735 family protein n=1 Tax=uncultured Mesonia sp. TaxID=399731 RepID=UPI00374E81FA